MKHTENNDIQEKPVIMIENSDVQASEQEVLEEPIITIESDDSMDSETKSAVVKQSKLKKWGKRALAAVAIVVLVLVCYKAIRLYNYYFNIGVSVSVSPKDNIGKLAAMKAGSGDSEVVLNSDSILGVALNIYELHNVKAEMTLAEPDTADQNVLMYTRSCDYNVTGKYIGSLVIDGEEMQSDVSRLGYCAISGGNMVIGVSRSDKVKSYIVDHDGSYFRQFLLLSDGELPKRFFLHGKVERKALARTTTDNLCIVETRHPETLWDFADALREYGFVDAIYLTGGNESGFYRAPDGSVTYTEKAARYRTDKHHGVAPWLVLRRR